VPLRISAAPFYFAFEMRDFLPAWDKEGGFKYKPSKEEAKSQDFDLGAYLFPWGGRGTLGREGEGWEGGEELGEGEEGDHKEEGG
jgi:hypothetical protein